jgi:hypothetical protein
MTENPGTTLHATVEKIISSRVSSEAEKRRYPSTEPTTFTRNSVSKTR